MVDHYEWPLFTTLLKDPYKTRQGYKVQVIYQPNKDDSFKVILSEKEFDITEGLSEFVEGLTETTMTPQIPVSPDSTS